MAATGTAGSFSQTQPRVAVGSRGELYVLQLVTDRQGRIGVWVSESSDGGRRFGAGRWVSNVLASAHTWLAQYHGWFGDYQGLAVRSGTLHAVWNDDRSGKVELMTAAIRTD